MKLEPVVANRTGQLWSHPPIPCLFLSLWSRFARLTNSGSNFVIFMIDNTSFDSRSLPQHPQDLPMWMQIPKEHLRLSRAMACPTAGHYRWRLMEEYSSSTITRKRPLGSIREPARRVLPPIRPVSPTDPSSIRSTTWDRFLTAGRRGFTQMDAFSSLITVSVERFAQHFA